MEVLEKIKGKIKKVINFIIYQIVLKIVFNIYKKKPIREDIVVFAYDRVGYEANFEFVETELRKRGNYQFIDLVSINKELSRIERWKKLIVFTKYYAFAKYIIVCDYQKCLYANPKREETVVVQVWHACGAFKRFGYSSLTKAFGVSLEHAKKKPFHTNYSLVPVSGEEVVPKYAEAFNMEDRIEDIMPIGVPRTDIFFEDSFINDSKNKLIKTIPNLGGKKVILYAPTFRGSVKNAKIENQLNYEELYKALSDEYVLILKYHPMAPKEDASSYNQYKDFIYDISDTMNISELLSVADICVADYSSLVFEYSIFEKPMIFFAYDLEDYIDERGFYYSYRDFIPGPLVQTNQELLEEIKNIDVNFDKNKVAEFRKKFMGGCDGESTKRVVDEMLRR